MRVALISDIHGNAVALDAALADLDARGYDRLVCLGDAVQGGPQPAEVVARLRALGCPVIMGNADDYLLTGADSGAEAANDDRRRRLADTRDWSLAQLSAADRAFIGAFVPTLPFDLDGGWRLQCAHGSPRSYDDLLLPDAPHDEFARLLAPDGRTIFSGGHTHVQFVRQFPDGGFFINPGSVGFAWRYGQPVGTFRADPWAEYALLDWADGDVALTFRRVPFDVAAYRAAIRASGMPYTDEVLARYDTAAEQR